MIPVEGFPNLYRDEQTGAIVNCDNNSYNQYLSSLRRRRNQLSEIDSLKQEVKELKTLVMQLIKNES
jgi:hypothetical protein